jgi:hypothetical protein
MLRFIYCYSECRYAKCLSAECRYAERCYAECRGASSSAKEVHNKTEAKRLATDKHSSFLSGRSMSDE